MFRNGREKSVFPIFLLSQFLLGLMIELFGVRPESADRDQQRFNYISYNIERLVDEFVNCAIIRADSSILRFWNVRLGSRGE